MAGRCAMDLRAPNRVASNTRAQALVTNLSEAIDGVAAFSDHGRDNGRGNTTPHSLTNETVMKTLLAALLVITGCASSQARFSDEPQPISVLTVKNMRSEDAT